MKLATFPLLVYGVTQKRWIFSYLLIFYFEILLLTFPLIIIHQKSQTELEIEPRYPMFGGWKTEFTIGYGLPLQDFLFGLDGKRFLNITFGSPMNELVIDTLFVKVSENILS